MSDPELNDREISIHTTTQVVTDIMEALQQQNKISIHTTTQVVTAEISTNGSPWIISIHTTTQVVTPSRQRLKPCLTDFNPHHHAGGDFYSESHWNYIIYFNPHHHAGGDVAIMSCWSIRFYFNPHHHAGGDQPYGVHIWKYVKFQSTPPRRW